MDPRRMELERMNPLTPVVLILWILTVAALLQCGHAREGQRPVVLA